MQTKRISIPSSPGNSSGYWALLLRVLLFFLITGSIASQRETPPPKEDAEQSNKYDPLAKKYMPFESEFIDLNAPNPFQSPPNLPDHQLPGSHMEAHRHATKAAIDENLAKIKALYLTDPAGLVQTDKNGQTPAVVAAVNGQFETLETLYPVNPALVFPSWWIMASAGTLMTAVLSYAIIRIIYARPEHIEPQENDRPRTSINVHDEDRDQKTVNAFYTLIQHIGVLPMDYFDQTFLSDLGIKEVSLQNFNANDTLHSLVRNATHYIIAKRDDDRLRLEFIIKNRVIGPQGHQLTINIKPEIGYPDDGEPSQIVIDSSQSLSHNNQTYLAGSWHMFYHVPPISPSAISLRFETDPAFRYALGFATIYPQPFNPVLFDTVEGTSISGNHFLSAAYFFCKQSSDPQEIKLRETAFINGILDGIEPKFSDPNKWHRLCTLGQMQYLLLPLLQGRLADVLIDNPSMTGVIPDPAQLVSVCSLNADLKGKKDSRDDYFKFVEDIFVPETPVLSGPGYDDIKRAFFRGIEEEAIYLDPYPWVRDEKESGLAIPMLYLKNLLNQRFPNGRTAATHACAIGDMGVLKGLHVLDPELLGQEDKNKWTPATFAAWSGNITLITTLHELNPKLLSQPGALGWTPAIFAATEGHTEIIQLLHDLNPEFLRQNTTTGNDPATYAAINRKIDVIKTLHRIDPKFLRQMSNAAITIDVSVTRVLYQLDPELLKCTDCAGLTPATYAAIDGNVDTLKVLYELNPDLLSESDGLGFTPATYAAHFKNGQTIRTLYELNPDLLRRSDKNGETPATIAGVPELIDLFRELAPDLITEIAYEWDMIDESL